MTNFYSIASELNDGKVFKPEAETKFCSNCDSIISLSFNGYEPFEPKIKGFDISYSYDGILIVSQKFKDACSNIGVENIEFFSINEEEKLYVLQVKSIIGFDAEARKTRFVNKCDQCGEFESIVGATPVFLKEPIDGDKIEFLSTDLQFGSGRKKHSLIVINEATKKALEGCNLKGLRFKKGMQK